MLLTFVYSGAKCTKIVFPSFFFFFFHRTLYRLYTQENTVLYPVQRSYGPVLNDVDENYTFFRITRTFK